MLTRFGRTPVFPNLVMAALTLWSVSAPLQTAASEELRIGFLTTKTGPGALIGQFLENGFRLGLQTEGWMKDGDKLAGVPTRMFVGDDQQKPDVALAAIEKMLKQDRVHAVTGGIWGNVFNAVAPKVFAEKKLLVGGVSGLAQYAGEGCSPLFVSTSHQNDQIAEALGELSSRRGVKSVVAMAPNYQSGREFVDAFAREYKTGNLADRILFKLGQTDFQAEFARVRALKPDAVMVFAPGAMGIAFVRQWRASGLGASIELHSIYTIDDPSLKTVGEDALGMFDTNSWSPDLPNPVNERFVREYVAAFGALPANISVYGYDMARALATGVRATGGKTEAAATMARAIRLAPLDSPRGQLRFNVNGFAVQPYYAREVVRRADGNLAFVIREKGTARRDSFWQRCPDSMRIGKE